MVRSPTSSRSLLASVPRSALGAGFSLARVDRSNGVFADVRGVECATRDGRGCGTHASFSVLGPGSLSYGRVLSEMRIDSPIGAALRRSFSRGVPLGTLSTLHTATEKTDGGGTDGGGSDGGERNVRVPLSRS